MGTVSHSDHDSTPPSKVIGLTSQPLSFPGVQERSSGTLAPRISFDCVSWRALEGQVIAWDALAACAAEPNPFFESWYLLAALRASDPEGRIRLARLEVDGMLAGLLPVVQTYRYYGRPLPNLTAWIHGNCFLGTPLVARGLERVFWRELLAWADDNAGPSLFLHVSELGLDGSLYAALKHVLDDEDRFGALVMRSERAMLSATETPDGYFAASLSGKKRKELRRQFTRLSELGAISFERQRDAQELDRWTEDFLALEASGWKGRAGTALALHDATAALFRESLRGAAARRKLERLTLRLNGLPIAMLATFLAAPGAFSFKTAFDEAFARFSPGVLLQRENLAILADEAIAWSDSCASPEHPMIDHFWRERRPIGRISIAIGGRLRRTAARRLMLIELGRAASGARLQA